MKVMTPELPYSAGKATAANPPNNSPFDEIVVGAAGCVRPLPGEQPIDVAVKRHARHRAFLQVTLGARPCESLAERAWLFTVGRGPVQAVFLSLGADEPVGVVQQRILLQIAHVVLALRIDVSQAGLDGSEFVLTDSAVDDLLGTRFGVEMPLSVLHDDGNGEGPFVRPHFESDRICRRSCRANSQCL